MKRLSGWTRGRSGQANGAVDWGADSMCFARTAYSLFLSGMSIGWALVLFGIGSASGQLVVTNSFRPIPTQLTLSACQITEQVTTNWIAIPGALHIEPDTNGNQVSFSVERETISTNVILKATYAGKEYSYILESHQRATPSIHKRMVPIQAERPPFPPPLPVPVMASSNAVYYREQRP